MTNSVPVLGNKYLRAIFVLVVLMAATQPVVLIGGIVFWQSLHSNQELVLDCVTKERQKSECQTYANERTSKAVGTLIDITGAYVLCADKYNGDAVIKDCVADTLKQNPPGASSNGGKD